MFNNEEMCKMACEKFRPVRDFELMNFAILVHCDTGAVLYQLS